MSLLGESLNVHLLAASRNRFLQPATGLFGGDIESGLLSYSISDEHYRSSVNYATAVSAEGGGCHRAALAAWYLMNHGTLYEQTMAWNVSNRLWMNVRVPNQCITLIEDGIVMYATIDTSSTQTVCQLTDLSNPIAGPYPKLNRPYVVRARRPRQTTYGPILVCEDGQTVVVQANTSTFIPPVPGRDLVYLGARGSHPVRTAAWQPFESANQYVFGVDHVMPISGGALRAIRPSTIATDWQTWRACGENAIVAVCNMANNRHAALAGIDYPWPFPEDQDGQVNLLIPVVVEPILGSQDAPDGVYYVKAMVVDLPMVEIGVVDDTMLTNGDRVAHCLSNPAAVVVWEWNETTNVFVQITVTPTPTMPVVIVDSSRPSFDAWWDGRRYSVVARQRHFVSNGSLRVTDDAPVPPDPILTAEVIALAQLGLNQAQADLQTLQDAKARAELPNSTTQMPPDIVISVATARVSTAMEALRVAEAAAVVQDDPPVNHLVVVITRGSEGWYSPQPRAAVSSLRVPMVGWTWMYPADPNDRFVAAGLTDGLIGSISVVLHTWHLFFSAYVKDKEHHIK
jgi:hypothetical protein